MLDGKRPEGAQKEERVGLRQRPTEKTCWVAVLGALLGMLLGVELRLRVRRRRRRAAGVQTTTEVGRVALRETPDDDEGGGRQTRSGFRTANDGRPQTADPGPAYPVTRPIR